MNATTPQIPILGQETDWSLIEMMGDIAKRPDLAKAAAGELFWRRSRPMTAACKKEYFYRQNHEELVADTFQKALKGAPKFALVIRAEPSDERKARIIKAWLYEILRNTCIDAHRREKLERRARRGLGSEEVEKIFLNTAEVKVAPPSDSREIELMEEFCFGLSPRNRKIFRNATEYTDPRTGAVSMPDDVHRSLMKELRIKAGALRAQRQRLLKKARQYVEARR